MLALWLRARFGCEQAICHGGRHVVCFFVALIIQERPDFTQAIDPGFSIALGHPTGNDAAMVGDGLGLPLGMCDEPDL